MNLGAFKRLSLFAGVLRIGALVSDRDRFLALAQRSEVLHSVCLRIFYRLNKWLKITLLSCIFRGNILPLPEWKSYLEEYVRWLTLFLYLGQSSYSMWWWFHELFLFLNPFYSLAADLYLCFLGSHDSKLTDDESGFNHFKQLSQGQKILNVTSAHMINPPIC